MERKREIWIDDVKVIACILVVLGHFFQSMTKAKILPTNDLYQWFNQTIYYFHVPLFFICSGYLYQKFSNVSSVRSWEKNIIKKALTLGIPYFTFSSATWLLKTLFSGSVNNEIGGLTETLFFKPTSPYWYLYALFFIFLITPTFASMRMAFVWIIVALVGKILISTGGGYEVYVVSAVLLNEIWFLLGMYLSVIESRPRKMWINIMLGILFVILSIVIYRMDFTNGVISFFLGLLACASVIGVVRCIDYDRSEAVFSILSTYTMPIFLMHTLFAAPFRSMLLKIGISNAVIHIVVGLIISFVGPIIADEVMKKTKVLEFFLYPGKFIKLK